MKQGNVNLTWSRAAHLLNFGGSFTQVNTWTTAANGTQFVPTINFSLAANDPVNTGATNLFTTTNFPGSTPTNLSDAGAIYALLTGRVSSISRSVVLDDQTKTYGQFQPDVFNYQREIGLYVQDSWRIHPRLTINYGVRYDRQNPPVNQNGVYTRPGYAGVWGVSGNRESLRARHAHRIFARVQSGHQRNRRVQDPEHVLALGWLSLAASQQRFQAARVAAWQRSQRVPRRLCHLYHSRGWLHLLRVGYQPGPHRCHYRGPQHYARGFRRAGVGASSGTRCP